MSAVIKDRNNNRNETSSIISHDIQQFLVGGRKKNKTIPKWGNKMDMILLYKERKKRAGAQPSLSDEKRLR
jgi:hypothetical protein